MIVLTRKEAMVLAWRLFWFATGTYRLGIITGPDSIDILGADLITEGDKA